jgi:hypothetical protein
MKKRLSLPRIFKLRDKLFQTLKPYIGLNIAAETLKDLIADVYRILPNYVSHDAVFETCRNLAGAVLSKKLAAEFAWRLAGNIDLLLRSIPVIPWTRQMRDEWMPVQVLSVDPAVRWNKPGYSFKCRALAGSFAPGIFEQFMSRTSCSVISSIVGFSRNMPHTNPVYFTGLRFWAFVEAAKSSEGPQFQQIDCATAMKAHNKKLIAIRTRAAVCPQNFEHACEHCPIGYDTCIASVFAKGLELRACTNCNKEAYFDTTRSEEYCFGCWTAKRIKNAAGV